MMIQWNTCHESQYQLRLVWHHMISWSKLAIKIDKRNQDDQYWQSHDFMIKIDDQDWLHDHIENSCDLKLYSKNIASI